MNLVLPRIFLVNFLAILLISSFPVALSAEEEFAENPESCNQLFGLPEGTIRMDPDKGIMSSEVCGAYLFLISRYTPGPRSSVGLSNPKVEGITKLNPDFAVALAKMLKSAPAMGIISAYRTPEGQGAKNPQSNHIYGCAVDLGYSQSVCSQIQCQWVLQNAPSFGLHIRMMWSPEWNHIEPIAKDACRSNGPGVGDPVAAPPSSSIANYARQLLGGSQSQPSSQLFGQSAQQNCTLPDGVVVPCSSIANQGMQQQPTISPIQGTQQGGTQGTQQRTPITGQSADLSGATQTEEEDAGAGTLGSKSLTESILEKLSRATTSSVSSSTKKLTAFEQISIFAKGTTSSETPSGTTTVPLVLVVSGENAVGIQSQSQNEPVVLPQNDASVTPAHLPITSQQTFTSPDLGGPAFGEPSVPASQTTFTPYQKILTDMQSVVRNMLAYLKPFGRPIESTYANEYSDWAE